MLDIGWSELVLIGVVALIVVGPKDLPQMFRTLGRFTAKARAMAKEFSSAMETAAKESGLDDATRDLRNMTSKRALGLDALETAASKFEAWKPNLTTPAAAASAVTAAAATPATTPATGAGTVEDGAAAAPRGAATQALADKLAAKAAERANPTTALIPDPEAPAAGAVVSASKTPRPRAARATGVLTATTATATAKTADAAPAPATRKRKAADPQSAADVAVPGEKTPRRKKTTT